MSEAGPYPDQEDDGAEERSKREEVRREEEAGVRYSPSDVFRQLDEQSATLEGGAEAGEKKVLDEQFGEHIDEAMAGALRADREKQEHEAPPPDATFFSVEQQLRADTQIEAIADDSADEQNLVGMLGACQQVGSGIFERKDGLSLADRAKFEQAAKLLREAETLHASALKAFRRHLLEGQQDEAEKDFQLYRESILGHSLETVTAQWRVLERLKFMLDHPSKKERK